MGLLGCSDPAPASPSADAGVVERTAEAARTAAAEPTPRVATRPAPSPARAPSPAAEAPSRSRIEPRAGDTVSIPRGTLHVGSRPGRAHRRPSVEADLVPVEIPAFDVDRLPYPNDPARPPQLAATRAEAEGLCEERGRRLCHELEWERACRGDGRAPFPTGESLDLEACLEDPNGCASPLGVLELGFRAPEWTASDGEPRLSRLERTAVVRGGRPDDAPHLHRCGTRRIVNPLGGGRALAFRCCGGPAPELDYPDVGERRPFRDLELEPERWREILASVPELAPHADDFQVWGEAQALSALGRGGATEEDMQWELTRGPFAWSPSPGEEVWIVAGHGGGVSLIAALYPLPDGGFLHAASFLLAEEDPVPVAILRTRAERGELLWSTCWSCGGEDGAIRFDEDARIVIVQR
jgi:formylglycine-generating enzyme required for sulfatase activity